MISRTTTSAIRGALALGFALGWSFACADSLSGPAAPRPPADEERRILVAFPDGSIGRIPSGDSTNGYRRRGHYGSSTWGVREAGDLRDRHALAEMDQWPIPVLGMHCVVYRVPEGRSVEVAIEGLQREDGVALVERMRTFRTLAEVASDPYSRLQPALKTMRVADVHPFATGANVQVAVIDTGVDVSHPDLVEQIADSKNFTAHEDTSVADIHGTAVAGIIAAQDHNRTGIVGIAPDAKVLSLKACWPEQANRPASVCDTFTLAQALNTAIQKNVRIVNMSLAGPGDPLLELLIKKGLAQGITFVASVPPDGSRDDFPASVDGVIAVRSAGSVPPAAAVAPHSVAAPGTEILTTLPNHTYSFVTGSSYATAHVSGLIALMLQARRDLDNHAVLEILKGSIVAGDANASGREPIVDACRVFHSIDSRLSCPSAL
ncbi:S8 family serine peptidase [Methylotetracoccus oryzae]|uniref:S8 family serine peptidase n=1 Tax=Methylotetracoccus oryzae TaxID=1919059 RepID=UPI0011199882|nr:S8 family serine peptidase [Methylotetracoccus oryzae]